MTSGERVLLALNKKEPDRGPLFYRDVPEVEKRLLRDLNLPGREALLKDYLWPKVEHFDFSKIADVIAGYEGYAVMTAPGYASPGILQNPISWRLPADFLSDRLTIFRMIYPRKTSRRCIGPPGSGGTADRTPRYHSALILLKLKVPSFFRSL
ncbi:MAG: hypothetical protein ACLFSE_05885 [Spirochaetia bacterium]